MRRRRHLARRLHLALVDQRRAARPDRLHQRAGAVEQRPAPVAVAADRLDHALLEPAHHQLGLRLHEALQRGDPGGDQLGDDLAEPAHLE